MVPCLLLMVLGSLQDPAPELVIPGYTAYGIPDRDRFQVDSSGIHNWTNPQEVIQWHGKLSKGSIVPTLNVRLPAGQTSQLHLSLDASHGFNDTVQTNQHFRFGNSSIRAMVSAEVTGQGDDLIAVPFPELRVPEDGYMTITVSGVQTSGAAYPDIESITLKGTGIVGAHFNLKERRNAASVHLSYPTPKGAQVSWFYNEVTPQLDPLYTYYMACGFSRGYFGMQVNSRTERRIIFSVWDSGAGDDPALKSPDDKTRLIAKGDGVEANAFGNEGTGGHSHLVYPWVVGTTYRFLVGAKVDGDGTIYSGYFYDNGQKKWLLIASFRAPKDGKLLRGLYSFDEDFSGANGDLERMTFFGNGWYGTTDDKWKALLQARFTHDATGEEDRLDYAATAAAGHFVLQTGGFVDQPTTKLGAILIRDAIGEQPKDLVLPPSPPPN